jgi:hypothetical protein
MEHVFKLFGLNEIVGFIVFTSMIIIQSCKSFDLIFDQIR